jgi:16S rRNA (uracil1498-N3)-methyltransferase
MDKITLLAQPGELDAGEATVEGEAYRHLFRARRLPVGASIRVVDGRGRARWGKVARVDRNSARVSLGDSAPTNEPALRLDLLVPTFRPERVSWMVEKATEIGAMGIHFFNMERAPRSFGGGTLERLRRVAISALEQCHRSRLPEITGPHAWNEIGRLTPGAERRWFLDPEGGTVDSVERGSAALLVGPEGGLAPEERQALLEAGWAPIGLGPRILRIETAAVAGAAMVLLACPKIDLPAGSG